MTNDGFSWRPLWRPMQRYGRSENICCTSALRWERGVVHTLLYVHTVGCQGAHKANDSLTECEKLEVMGMEEIGYHSIMYGTRRVHHLCSSSNRTVGNPTSIARCEQQENTPVYWYFFFLDHLHLFSSYSVWQVSTPAPHKHPPPRQSVPQLLMQT